MTDVSNTITRWSWSNHKNITQDEANIVSAIELGTDVQKISYIDTWQPKNDSMISFDEQYIHNITTDYTILGRNMFSLKNAYQNQAKSIHLIQIQRHLNSYFVKLAPTYTTVDQRADNQTSCENNPYRQGNFDYAFHCDDIQYMYGLNFCHENYPCYLVCDTNSDLAIKDKEASLNYIYEIFHGQGSEITVNPSTGDVTFSAAIIGPDGLVTTEHNFWQDKFSLFGTILPEIYEKFEKKESESDPEEPDQPENGSPSVLTSLVLVLISISCI